MAWTTRRALLLLGALLLLPQVAAQGIGPLFLWEHFGLKGVVQDVVSSSGRNMSFEANGLRATVGDYTYVWDPTNRTLRFGEGITNFAHHFDAAGRKIRTTYRDTTYAVYEYSDGFRTLTEVDHSRSSGPYVKEIQTLDAAGRTISRAHYDENETEPTFRQEMEYNEQGDQVGFRSYDEDGALSKELLCNFVYDQQENWIERACFEWVPALGRYSNNAEVELREITYY